MFFFGRKTIQDDARNIAEWVIKFRDDLFASKDLIDFIERLNNYQVDESYLDDKKKECGWLLKGDKRFVFHAEFAFTANSPRCLIVEAKENYFGVVITTTHERDINVSINTDVKLGSKAINFQKMLLSFPNFDDLSQIFNDIYNR